MKRNIDCGYYEEAPKNIYTKDGKAFAKYRDSGVFNNDDGEIRTERHMKIKNRNVYVRSFFPSAPSYTPTDKLLQLVCLNEK